MLCLRDLTERRRYEIAHGEEARFRSLVHNAGAVTMLVTADGIIESVSAAITRLTGIDPEDMLGRRSAALVVAEDQDRVCETLAADGQRHDRHRHGRRPRAGARRWAPADGAHRRRPADDPTVGGYVVSAHDVTERVAVETELRVLRRHSSGRPWTRRPTASSWWTPTGRITSCNRRFAEMWHMPETVLEDRDDERALSFVLDQLADPEAFIRKVEELYAQPDAESYDMLDFSDGRVFERFSIPQRVDGRSSAGSGASATSPSASGSRTSSCTGRSTTSSPACRTRRASCDRVQHAAERSERSAEGFAVLFLDVDNFKTVNDSLGHEAGDRLLVSAAERLGSCLRVGDTPALVGGDEFAVLLEHVSDPDTACRLAERIRDAFRTSDRRRRSDVVATVSIGIAFGGRGSTSEQILRDADLAMYTAKCAGKDRFELFESAQHDAAVVRVEVAADLQRAVDQEELRLAYQPIVDTRTDSVVVVEALVRWDHPTRGCSRPESSSRSPRTPG